MPRPVPCFRNFVGHRREVDLLRRQLDGARARGEPFPDTLFSGPSGVGKTELARALAAESGTSFILASGYDLVAEIATKVRQCNHCDFLFIDEAHNLLPDAQELLYPVIDERRISLRDQKRSEQGGDTSWAKVEPCTVILATDQPGKLQNALQKRMQLNIRLCYYTLREMKAIVDRLATNLNILLSPQAANRIAGISGGLPRNARHHLQNLRRHFPEAERQQLGTEHIRQFMHAFGINANGLGKMEREYLRCLLKAEPASLDSLGLHLGMDSDYVRGQIEPVLRRAGMVVIGSGGRRLTEAGRKWIESRDNSH